MISMEKYDALVAQRDERWKQHVIEKHGGKSPNVAMTQTDGLKSMSCRCHGCYDFVWEWQDKSTK